MIYRCFVLPYVAPQELLDQFCPELDPHAYDRRKVLETRKSLFLVCHEANNQWTPIFFEDAIVWANSPSSNHRALKYRYCFAKCTSAKFDRVFLRKTCKYKLSCIRKLIFNGSLRDEQQYSNKRLLDHGAIDEFIASLHRQQGSLKSLEWVQILGYLRSDRGRVPSTLKPTPSQIFSLLDNGRKFRQLQAQIQSVATQTIFPGWTAGISMDLRDSALQMYVCSAIRLTLGKCGLAVMSTNIKSQDWEERKNYMRIHHTTVEILVTTTTRWASLEEGRNATWV